MIAVGIDVSKSKSTVAILNGDGSIRAKPFDVHHVADELQALVDYIKRVSLVFVLDYFYGLSDLLLPKCCHLHYLPI